MPQPEIPIFIFNTIFLQALEKHLCQHLLYVIAQYSSLLAVSSVRIFLSFSSFRLLVMKNTLSSITWFECPDVFQGWGNDLNSALIVLLFLLMCNNVGLPFYFIFK